MFNQMSKAVEEAITQAAVMKSALSELERFSSFLSAGLRDSAQMSTQETDDALPERRPHVYVSNEPLQNECDDEGKFLILGIRCLARQQRYEEALSLAKDAARLVPSYWRAWVTLGTLLALFGKVDDAEEIFRQVMTDFADDPKAVAAGLHGHAWINEIRFGLAPPADVFQETTRLYETSLRLDESRANTRACLVINRLTSDGIGGHEKILEDSVLREEFLENLRLELDERGAKMHEVLKAIPTWLKHLLYPIRLLDVSESNG
ncbi:MAG: tetratricopeptide repeat protein [Acidobacteria bacterium]|nr:tetratricopeptide repeat protein [Acidobacteriota bacterium]